MSDLLTRILSAPQEPFALIYRPERDRETVEAFRLVPGTASTIADAVSGPRDRLIVLPYAQVKERSAGRGGRRGAADPHDGNRRP